VIEQTATELVYERSVSAMALVCEVLAQAEDDEVGDTLMSVLSPAWKSGDVDVPALLSSVQLSGEGNAARGAAEALRWLGLRT
jgi:hypothetical protein